MMTFLYTAKTRAGQTVEGEIFAHTSQEAIQLLRQQEIMVIRLQEKVQQVCNFQDKFTYWSRQWNLSGIGSKELVVFTHQLATLIRAGVPLLECLDLLSSEMEQPIFRQVIAHIREEVESGVLLAHALKHYPGIFHKFYRNMVEVGEMTGRLDESLAQLAVYLDKQMQLRAKIFSGLAYPALLVAVAMIVLIFLLIWVVPLFSALFRDMGQSLPWLTQLVIDVAEGLKSNLLLVLPFLGGLTLGIRYMLKSRKGRQTFDGLLLRAPLLGSLFRKAAIVRFARTLGFLIQRGVPLLTALGIAGTVTGNMAIEQRLHTSASNVQDGKPLSEALRASQIFPSMVTQMIKVGESTGALDVMLDKVAELFEQEVDRTITTLTSILEPCVILVVGCGIGVVVVAMYLPIFSIGSVIG